MIYKDVVNVLIDALSRFKGVNFVKYQGDDLNNQQQNYKTIQCYIDDMSFHQFNLTQNIAKVEFQVYILGFPENNTPDAILDVQDECYNVALNVLAYVDTNDKYKGLVSLYDYSILTLSRYSEQSNAGVKLSIVLTIPNGVDMCTMLDNFGEPYTPEPDNEIDINKEDVGDITLKPIKLIPDRKC